MKFLDQHRVLSWAEVLFHSSARVTWWSLMSYGSTSDRVTSYPAYLENKQFFSYYLPVVAEALTHEAIPKTVVKLLLPPCFIWRQKVLDGFRHHSYYYVWTVKTEILPWTSPKVCARCGWYCLQTCGTWSI